MTSVLGNCFVCQVVTQTKSFLKPGKFSLTDCQALIVESANAHVKVLAYHLCTYHLFPCGSTCRTPLGNCFSRLFSGAVVRALPSHQCGPGLIPTSGLICGLKLLVLYSAPGGFLWVLWFPLLVSQLVFLFKFLRPFLHQQSKKF